LSDSDKKIRRIIIGKIIVYDISGRAIDSSIPIKSIGIKG